MTHSWIQLAVFFAVAGTGLCQIGIQVPTTLAAGDWPILASIGYVTSPGGIVLSIAQ